MFRRSVAFALSILLLAPLASAWAGTITAGATGTWSSTSTWTGGVVPGNGDVAVIPSGKTVTVNQDIGTAGNGIKSIYVAGTLSYDNAAVRTITFASSGTNPIGSGSTHQPDMASATMFGLLIPGGTVNFTATGSNKVILTSQDDTSPIYIKYDYGDYNAPSGGSAVFGAATCTLKQCDIRHLGTNTTGYKGLNWYAYLGSTTNGILDIEDCKISDYYQAITFDGSVSGSSWSCKIKRNYFTGRRGTYSIYYPSAVFIGHAIQDNTEANATVNGDFCHSVYAPGNVTYSGNVVFGASASVRAANLTMAGSANGVAAGGNSVYNNAVLAPALTADATYSDILVSYFAAATDTTSAIYGNVGYNTYTGIDLNAASGGGFLVKNNWTLSNAHDYGSQGNGAIVRAGTWTLFGSVTNLTGATSGSIAFLLYKAGSVACTAYVDHCTVVYTGSGTGGNAIYFGDTSGPASVNCKARGNLVVNMQYGISDTPGTTGSTYATDSPYSAGVHHNASYNCGSSYQTLASSSYGGTGWTDGSHLHPNSVYGDLDGTNPAFVDTTRTPLSWSTSLGGAGTLADLATQFSQRSAVVGTADGRYTVASLLAYLQGGFAPTASATKATGWSSDSYIVDAAGTTWPGATPGYGAVAWVNPVSIPVLNNNRRRRVASLDLPAGPLTLTLDLLDPRRRIRKAA